MSSLFSLLFRSQGLDFQSLPVIFTAFAAAFLGSLVAPLLSDGLTRILSVDEVQIPALPGTTRIRMDVPRFWNEI